MSVIELMISICIIAVVLTFGVPFYISAMQQGRVVSLIIPRLHMLESRITLFYVFNERLPSREDLDEVLAEYDAENLDIDLVSGVITMTIRAPDQSSKLHILDGTILLAYPVISPNGVVAWHLDGELADRLQISY
jgi:type II secretory pathway pseudopilin PulG